MKYIRELDSLRGIGIILVVLFHWIPVDAFYNTFPNRPFGVDVFFVLSGYLITHILLAARMEAEKLALPRRKVFLHFYLRRALRILPAYFLVLLLIALTHTALGANVRTEMLPALTFILNFHFHEAGYWGDLTTHLWTISIEEQFYLVWPWIILLVRKDWLPCALGLFIAAGVVTQCLITDQEFGYLPTYTSLDAFGIGAMIAWVQRFRPGFIGKQYRIAQWLGAISTVILVLGAAFSDLVFLAPQRTLRSLMAAWAICFIIYKDHRDELQHIPVFSNPVLIFIGKISYGMYLYHLFFPWLYDYINAPVNALLPHALQPHLFAITVVENIVLLIGMSWLSYRYFERPVLQRAGRPSSADKVVMKKAWTQTPATP